MAIFFRFQKTGELLQKYWRRGSKSISAFGAGQSFGGEAESEAGHEDKRQ
jgi:hypothetical protein